MDNLPPSKADRETAIRVVMKAIVKDAIAIAQINPELALELPNILRCLER